MRVESLQSMQDSMSEDMDQRSLVAALDLLETKGGLNHKEAKEMLLLIFKELNQNKQFATEMDYSSRMLELLAKVTDSVQTSREKAALNKIMEDMETMQQLGKALSNSGAKMEKQILTGQKEHTDQLAKEMSIQSRVKNRGQSGSN